MGYLISDALRVLVDADRALGEARKVFAVTDDNTDWSNTRRQDRGRRMPA